MGCICSKKSSIKIHDCLSPADFSRLNGTITLSFDREYGETVFNMKFDGWYEKNVRI